MAADDQTEFSPKPSPGVAPTPPHYERSQGGTARWQPPTVEHLQALLPQYEILTLLGHGGMGAVYKARQITLDRLVAIKILPPEAADNDLQFVERFKNEARTMAKLDHPGIVHVFDYGETAEQQLYFVMQFVDGTDVAQKLKAKGRLSPVNALAITAHVCDALQYAHNHGVIHRDIKPANVLITLEGQVKVADFGLAKAAESTTTGLTKSNMSMGTPDFVAPEALLIGVVPDHRADLYAVGVMLYNMLTGEIPRGMFKMPSQKAGTDPRFDEVIRRAMEQEPEHRYQNASEIRQDLDVILSTPLGQARTSEQPVQNSPSRKPTMKEPGPVRGKAAAPQRGKPRATAAGGAAKKSRVGLMFGGLGAVVVLAIGGFLLTKFMAPAPSESSSGPDHEASTPGPATPSPAGQTQWQKIELSDAEIKSRGFTKESGGIVVTNDSKFPIPHSRNGALRARLRWRSQPTGLSLDLRKRTMNDGSEMYVLSTYLSQYELIYQKHQQTSIRDSLQKVRYPQDMPQGQSFLLEVAVIGSSIKARLNGSSNLAVVDERSQGNIAIGDLGNANIVIEEVAYLNLDGVSQPEAALGWGSPAPSPISSATFATATKDKPFVNSLGMKFVPVPVTGGPTDKQRVLFGVWDTRVQDYQIFATETKRAWPKPPFEQGPTHPAVNVSWEDAQAFCAWLTDKERKAGKLGATERYRLPSDHEWSCAVGIGDKEDAAKLSAEKKGKIDGVFGWGTAWPPPDKAANIASEELRPMLEQGKFTVPDNASLGVIENYHDGYAFTSPVDSFAPNAFGLHDMGGNVQQWCEDWNNRDQKNRTLRGASWATQGRTFLLSSNRPFALPADRFHWRGFRVVLETRPPASAAGSPTPASTQTASASAAATQTAPFVNSLGMKFVPVKITGGPTDRQRVLFSIWETRVRDYEVFATETKREWPKPQFEQGPTHPVVEVSWEDAQAFCKWLTERERKAGKLSATERYRLPSDHEWSYAVGLGEREDPVQTPEEKSNKIPNVFPWGSSWPPPPNSGNYSGEEAAGHFIRLDSQGIIKGYRDGFPTTAPVGSFPASPLGLFDLSGNAAEWCEDRMKPGSEDRVFRTLTSAMKALGVFPSLAASAPRQACADPRSAFGVS